MADIRIFSAGYCTHPGCMALKCSGFASRCFPAQVYLLQTAKGLHLWDTGYAPHFFDAAKGIYRLYPMVTPVRFEDQESIVQQLHRAGIKPADLTSIVISHFHADHIAGLRDFPDVPIVCAAEAWESIQGLKGLRALQRAFLPGLIPEQMHASIRFMHALRSRPLPPELSPFTHGMDLDGSGEILLVPLPGHAIGHIGAFVHDGRGWTLLASDAAWAEQNYTELRGPSELSFLIQHKRSAYYETLHKLQALHARGVRIQLTHAATGDAQA